MVALVSLVGFVVASLLSGLAYSTFLRVQRLLGVTFLLGAFHTFAVRGTLASSPALTIYVAALTAAAVVGAGYRYLGDPLAIRRHRCRVDEVHRLDDQAVEIIITPVARSIEFRAGQFVYATFLQTGIPRESHPFTVASAPGTTSVQLAVKRLGDWGGAPHPRT